MNRWCNQKGKLLDLPETIQLEELTPKQKAKAIRDFILEKARETKEKEIEKGDSKATKIAGKDALWMEDLQKALQKVFRGGFSVKPYQGKKVKHQERILSVLTSDTHFGSLIDPRECPLAYKGKEESRRFGCVITQAADFKRQYRPETTLSLKILGDMFQNHLHDPREGAPLAQQCAATIYYFVQAILFLAQEFPQVIVNMVSGNHGRNKQRHDDRAVQQKWDSLETICYFAIKQAIEAAKVPNVKCHIAMRPYVIEKLFDKNAFYTHGDGTLKTGYPGRSINIKDLHKQILQWNTARNVGGPFHLFGAGHVHFGMQSWLPGNVMLLTNPPLVPADPFSLSIGSADVTCGQWMFESTRSHHFGDSRMVLVDDADDKPEFNKVIRPFDYDGTF